jgi:hypothetical protein
MQIMKTIAIQIDEDTAKEYNKITSEQRKRVESLFALLVQQELKRISLMQIMDDIADEAERNGLTPEILESILADDE